jgi:hypothetical protein
MDGEWSVGVEYLTIGWILIVSQGRMFDSREFRDKWIRIK